MFNDDLSISMRYPREQVTYHSVSLTIVQCLISGDWLRRAVDRSLNFWHQMERCLCLFNNRLSEVIADAVSLMGQGSFRPNVLGSL